MLGLGEEEFAGLVGEEGAVEGDGDGAAEAGGFGGGAGAPVPSFFCVGAVGLSSIGARGFGAFFGIDGHGGPSLLLGRNREGPGGRAVCAGAGPLCCYK